MSKFVIIFDLLPLVALILAWAFGSKPWLWAMTTWLGLWLVATICAVNFSADHPIAVLTGVLVLLFAGPLTAAMTGIALGGRAEKAPVEFAAEAYDGLSDVEKEKVKKFGFIIVKHGFHYFSQKLSRGGKRDEAGLLRKASKFF